MGTPADAKLAQVPLVEVPAQRGRAVDHWDTERFDVADPVEELVDVVDVVPGAVGDDQAERRPVHGRVAPDDGGRFEPRGRHGGALQGPVVVQVWEAPGAQYRQRGAGRCRPGRASSTPDWEVAGHLVAGRELPHFGDLLGATRLGAGAARAEAAA